MKKKTETCLLCRSKDRVKTIFCNQKYVGYLCAKHVFFLEDDKLDSYMAAPVSKNILEAYEYWGNLPAKA